MATESEGKKEKTEPPRSDERDAVRESITTLICCPLPIEGRTLNDLVRNGGTCTIQANRPLYNRYYSLFWNWRPFGISKMRHSPETNERNRFAFTTVREKEDLLHYTIRGYPVASRDATRTRQVERWSHDDVMWDIKCKRGSWDNWAVISSLLAPSNENSNTRKILTAWETRTHPAQCSCADSARYLLSPPSRLSPHPMHMRGRPLKRRWYFVRKKKETTTTTSLTIFTWPETFFFFGIVFHFLFSRLLLYIFLFLSLSGGGSVPRITSSSRRQWEKKESSILRMEDLGGSLFLKRIQNKNRECVCRDGGKERKPFTQSSTVGNGATDTSVQLQWFLRLHCCCCRQFVWSVLVISMP